MNHYIHIGGVVAVGFDPTSAYLLVYSYTGSGVFCTRSWKRLARDRNSVYAGDGRGIGIGPIDGQVISVTEMDYERGCINIASPDGRVLLNCKDDMGIEITTRES